MSTQVKEDVKSGKHRLLGEILVAFGYMNSAQVNEVLRDMKK